MFAEVYQNRRVLVTGCTGFAGAWLCLWLQSLGAKVSGLALRAPEERSLFTQAALAEHMACHWGDVRNAEAVRQAVRAAEPDIIFHLALPEDAQAGGSLSEDMRPAPSQPEDFSPKGMAPAGSAPACSPEETLLTTGTLGTWHVLDAAARADSPVRAVLGVAADAAYAGAGLPHACREDAPCAPTAYGAACGCAAQVLRMCAVRHSGPCMALARTGCLLGGGDWRHFSLTAQAAEAWAAERPWQIAHAAVRPWQYVLDGLSGLLWLGAALFLAGEARAETAGANMAAALLARAFPQLTPAGLEGSGLPSAWDALHGTVWNCGPAADVRRPAMELAEDARRHFSGLRLTRATELAHMEAAGPQALGTASVAGASGRYSGQAAGPQALDSGKALALLGWRSVLTTEECVRAASDWYKVWRWAGTGKNPRGLRDVSLGQIAAYTAAAECRGAPWV